LNPAYLTRRNGHVREGGKKNLQILCSEVQEKKFTIFCVQKSKKRNKITVFVVFRKWQIIVCLKEEIFFVMWRSVGN
jgi:hypothetical protein